MLGIFLDTETSGLDPYQHVILEIALVIQNLKSRKTLATYETIVSHDRKTFDRSDPESIAINGFTWEMVQSGKPAELVASEIRALFKTHAIRRGKAVFICQNPSFDRPFFSHLIPTEEQEALGYPYHWFDLASMYWAKTPEPWKKSFSKDSIACAYKLDPEAKPHRAINGVEHLIACYDAVMAD